MDKNGTNRKALLSLIFAIVGALWALFLPFGLFAGLVLGILAIVYGVRARKENAGAMATAGIIVGAFALVTSVVALIFNLTVAV